MAKTFTVTLQEDEVEIMEQLLTYYRQHCAHANPSWLLATSLTSLAYLNKIDIPTKVTERHLNETLSLGYAPSITVYEVDNLPTPTHPHLSTRTH